MSRARPGWLGLAGGFALLACARTPAPQASTNPEPTPRVYAHNRADYERFQVHHPDLVEPNYLPFMAWRLSAPESEEPLLVFCRWPRAAFPLAVHVAPPEIDAALQDELRPVPPARFVAAARRALAVWAAELEGLAAFRVVDSAAEARLVLRLVAAPAPVPDPGVKVLGATPLGEACQVLGEPEADAPGAPQRGAVQAGPAALPVRFEVAELRIFVADEFGLLNPDQVERIALHEVGHALGMRGHSPVPNDLMYEIVRERPGRASLSAQDVNSFVSLYALPEGTIYRRLSAPSAPSPAPPAGAPRLALAPHVDPRLGFEIQLPAGWMKVPTRTGLAVIDGVTWDYTASLQLIVRRFPSVEAYLRRHAAAHVQDGTIVEQGFTRVAGYVAFLLEVQSADGRLRDLTWLIDAGDGRVFVVIADCPPETCGTYRPWFEAALATLEIWGESEGLEGRPDREYRRRP